MTFYEAALEVLRTAQRPLDYKTITQFAINRQLLGHIGHTPDITMASCLIRAIQRSDTGAVIRLENGNFALRGWPDEILQQDSPIIPQAVANINLPPQNIGLLDNELSLELLKADDIQFRNSIQSVFDNTALVLDDLQIQDDSAESKFEQVKNDLNSQKHEHYNLCAAIVKFLRNHDTPVRSAFIASALSQKFDNPVYEQSVVLAMRADNALRVSRGKRAVFMHLPPDLWTLTENLLTRQILKIESKIYDMSRQMRNYSLQALAIKLRELSFQAWQQLSTIILKHLNYTIISQCPEANTENSFIFRAEEARGLTYIPVIIKVLHTSIVQTDEIIQFRELIQNLGYDHGIIMANGDVSKDALTECTTKSLPIYAYAAKQIAPIMLDAKIGVIPNELPIVFIDHNFFQALSSKDNTPVQNQDNYQALHTQVLEEDHSLENAFNDSDEDICSGEYFSVE